MIMQTIALILQGTAIVLACWETQWRMIALIGVSVIVAIIVGIQVYDAVTDSAWYDRLQDRIHKRQYRQCD